MRYFITFACYGAHLHGDDSGSVDRYHNLFGSRPVKPDPHRAVAEREKMPQPPYWLDPDSREVVLNLLVAHVRTNHVHVVVEAEVQPERVMVEFKSYASRALNSLGLDGPDRRRWARHGSTRWLTLPRGRGSPLTLHFYVAHLA